MADEAQVAATLNAAIAGGPAWLRAWVGLLVLSHVAALAFAVERKDGAFRVRLECIAIVASFVVAAMAMNQMFAAWGYVRLLGLAHLLFWTPAFLWVLSKRRSVAADSWYGRYVRVYLLIAGTSLIIDAVDVVRYLLGDTAA